MADTRRSTLEEIAGKYADDWWTIAQKYRTGERLAQLITDAIKEWEQRMELS